MKILGDIGNVLARILDPEGGAVRLADFNDQDGITPVYDIGSVAEADLFSEDTRGFDTGAIAQSITSVQTVTALPPIYQVLGFFAVTDNAARLAGVSLAGLNVGAAASVRDDLLWLWVNGDPTVAQPVGLNIGDAGLGTLLVAPDTQKYFARGDVKTFQPAIKSRQGTTQLQMAVTSTAFGAGTVRVTGHVVIGFFRRGRFLVAARPL